MRVRATEKGFYGGLLREIGEEFEIAGKQHMGRWMQAVEPVAETPTRGKRGKVDDGGGEDLV